MKTPVARVLSIFTLGVVGSLTQAELIDEAIAQSGLLNDDACEGDDSEVCALHLRSLRAQVQQHTMESATSEKSLHTAGADTEKADATKTIELGTENSNSNSNKATAHGGWSGPPAPPSSGPYSGAPYSGYSGGGGGGGGPVSGGNDWNAWSGYSGGGGGGGGPVSGGNDWNAYSGYSGGG
eukprot:CAMPEP_0206572312 /NCGR_PEP_ID=MMETSP0325_2-20121206/28165_1 /ASSEMBLY_ACC=CAM_ASM_000347 /TAXON_ID=2866 /ORGANISM="Crypthecodinium cohnii, Strain Seligo" /LENGTH=180 /DNA_ID=CAMNT_0054076481 /DNA_START=43 /DNA_END=582 /DNA_ORIENTATION=-